MMVSPSKDAFFLADGFEVDLGGGKARMSEPPLHEVDLWIGVEEGPR
jgi:hypothetical protein